MAKKSKRFRIGVEGATTDGRVIEREWLTQMAASYNPQVYTALINMEHIKGFTLMGLSVVLAWWKSWKRKKSPKGHYPGKWRCMAGLPRLTIWSR